jgi:RNA polymerase sigma-70 factor (ECF subfamily)
MFWKRTNIDDSELKQAGEELKRGSAEAFHLLYKQYNQKVYRFCLRMLGDEDTAKDAFQEIFIKVYEHRTDFRGENFAAWLFTISRHTCYNAIRMAKDHEQLEEAEHISAKENLSDVGLKDVIQKTLDTLPLQLREALILREYEDLSYQQIAEVLGIEISLAKIRVFRAREIMRKLLTPLKQELYES